MRRGDWLSWPGEAQRREERRTEIRLAEGLQRLDQAKHYHLNTLTREQRRLSRDLVSIRTGNPWKRGLHSLGLQASNHDSGRPDASYKRTSLPIIPLAGKETENHSEVTEFKGSVMCQHEANLFSASLYNDYPALSSPFPSFSRGMYPTLQFSVEVGMDFSEE